MKKRRYTDNPQATDSVTSGSDLWGSSGFVVPPGPHYEPPFAGGVSCYASPESCCCLYPFHAYGRLHLLKTLKPEYAGVPLYETMLQKEFSIGYQLDHPNIRRTLGWDAAEGPRHGIILEYVDGVTLRELMDSGKLTRALSRKVAGELCSALQYMHSKQIVHRDLKPENILITYNGQNVKLIDFSLSDCDDSCLLKVPAGTRRYMAPELFQPASSWDLRCDIYSLGVILGEMGALLHDRRLKKVASVCTRLDKEKRYPDAARVWAALRRRNVWRWTAAAAAVAALLVGWQLAGQAGTSPVEADFALPPSRGNVVISPSCRQLLFEELGRVQSSHTCTEQDSLRLVTRLHQALDRDYPLPEQKQSAAYRQEWQTLVGAVGRLMNRRRNALNQ